MDLVAQSDILNKPITPEEAADPEALEAKRQEMLATAQKFARTAAAMLEERTLAANFVDHSLKKDREVDEMMATVKRLRKEWEERIASAQAEADGTLCSTKLSRIPTAQEIEEELQGQARMAAKVQETENKKASKARNREGERGQWWPCETTDTELRELQNEGMISAHWSFIRDTVVPKPGAGEVVMTKAWVERGLSLPCSEFFLSVLNTYGLQPHNICPNSYLLLSNFVTLCEGHLGIRPDVKLWQFFFRVKKETKDKAMLNCGSMTFMLRPGRMYPPHDSHESVRYWNAGWFYEKNVSGDP
ncbi:hypothetical protein QYE76_055402 [Lolium multiflorum]|uniref:Transposase (putative) gypsy type domain-containing protein n=1 Tax=Lolium multiflorum TaxID=4521 RepID=A0AAD8SZM9_LOLMU|nr:hypothetical protein QYE76_055402 [Lolium multiflorum]